MAQEGEEVPDGLSIGGSEQRRRSDDPADRLIRSLIRNPRPVHTREVQDIRDRIAGAGFNPTRLRVTRRYRGLSYQGRTVGNREEALFLHLVQRVVYDEEWAPGTTMAEYLEDLRSTVRDPDANVVLYERDEHAYAGIFGLNRVPPRRLGPQAG
ncbi:MAG: hypothetical protein QJR03_11130 [Sphaerobacter sp.]|nr:hypothetical protein [Sphaerobacter sp.]